MRISNFQLEADLGPEANRRAIIALCAHEAAASGSTLAVFPELAITGYGDREAIAATAPDVEALGRDGMARLAEDTGVALAVGMATRERGVCRNSAVVFRPGEEPLVYHKRQLYGRYEKALFEPARDPSPVFEHAGLKLGLLVCFDVEFPEYVRALALEGAEVVLVPTALPTTAGGRFIAEHMIPVRAFENQVFIAYSGHAGRDGRFAYQGLSLIAAPDGSVLAQAGETGPAHLTAILDPAPYEASRRENPYLEVAATLR